MSKPAPPLTLLAAVAGAVAGYQLCLWATPRGGLLRVANRALAELTGAAPAAKPAAGAASASAPAPRTAAPAVDGESAPPKMVIVVRRDLDMGRGKACAQTAHAALGVYKRARRTDPDLVKAWEKLAASAKVVLRADSESELASLAAAAAAAGLPSKTIADAGRTQVAPRNGDRTGGVGSCGRGGRGDGQEQAAVMRKEGGYKKQT